MHQNEAMPVGDRGRVIARRHPHRQLIGGRKRFVGNKKQASNGDAGFSRDFVVPDPGFSRDFAVPDSGFAYPVIKRNFDCALATLSLLVLLPGLVAIALAIKLTSPGPILFRQRRYGLNNKLFVIYKFRTMYLDQADETGVEQTRDDDRRVTPVGRLLRRFSLDELPQLFNVVKGNMSLVGPRPHVPGMLAAGVLYESLVPNYFERHRLKPGLTGLAQARGFRGSTADAERAKARIELDLKYIQTCSFMLDLRIIIETVWRELLKTGNGH